MEARIFRSLERFSKFFYKIKGVIEAKSLKTTHLRDYSNIFFRLSKLT